MTAPPPGPLFSVVTVTLNAGDALRRTVASTAAQTWPDLEHLVKDGGSTDGSLACIGDDPRVRVVSMPDRGIYDAMNQALRGCAGRFVLFLNAGDVFTRPTALAAVAARIGRGDADLYYCDLERSDHPGTVRYPDRIGRFFLFRRPLNHQACFFAASAYRRLGGFDPSFRLAADHELLVRALLRHGLRARRVPFAATVYEGGGFSASPANRARLAEEQRRIRERHFGRGQRVLFAVALGLTLRPLRVALFRHEIFRGVRPAYRRLANAWNRASWRPRDPDAGGGNDAT